jgi:hypothetical protein
MDLDRRLTVAAVSGHILQKMDILALMRERAGDYDCPKCSVALEGCELHMLREDNPQYTVQVTCSSCRISFIVVLQVRDRSTIEASAREDEPEGPPPAPPIAADELLDLHELLRDHDGPLSALFGSTADAAEAQHPHQMRR